MSEGWSEPVPIAASKGWSAPTPIAAKGWSEPTPVKAAPASPKQNPLAEAVSPMLRRSQAGLAQAKEGLKSFTQPADDSDQWGVPELAEPVHLAKAALKTAGGLWEGGPGAAVGGALEAASKPVYKAVGAYDPEQRSKELGDFGDQATGVASMKGPAKKLGDVRVEIKNAPKAGEPVAKGWSEPTPIPAKGRLVPPKAVAAKVEDPYDDIVHGPTKTRAPPEVVPAKPKTSFDVVKDGAKAVQNVLAPATTRAGRPVAETIRRSGGQHQLMADQATHDLLQHTRDVDKLSERDKLDLINDIEHGSDPNYQVRAPQANKTAKAIATVYDKYRKQIEYVIGENDKGGGPSFIRDYYTHLWKQNPDEVEASMRAFMSRQGSGKNLKARSIPTIEEGIAAGLTPVTTNPLEATSLYVQNMSRYLTTHDVVNHLEKSGDAKWFPEGGAPPGWKPLDGILTSKPGRMVVADGETVANHAPKKLYAPEDAARVYNNWMGKGFEAGKYAPFFKGARKFANFTTGIKLGLSAYHLSTMTVEAAASEAARAVQSLSRGKPYEALKAAPGIVPGVGLLKSAMRGKRLEKEILGVKGADSLSDRVNQAFANSGQQLRMDPLYSAHSSHTLYQSMKRGTFLTDVKAQAKRLYTGNMASRAAGAIDMAANVVQSMSGPLFEDLIPAVKRGAFANTLSDWIKANPEATQAEIDKAAIKVGDAMDDRFGELVQDNLFWDRHMKQTAQMVLLSPTWSIGTIRQIGGGIADIPKSLKGIMTGKGVTERTAYTAGLAATVATTNAVMQYLMTGKGPSSGRDLMAAQTGGTDETSGEPERMLIPGNQKDVYAFVDALTEKGSPGLVQELKAKLNPALTVTGDYLNNTDWKGDPKYRPAGVDPQGDDPSMLKTLSQDFSPISLSMMDQRKPGTKIPKGLTALGVRPAPGYITAPDYTRESAKDRNTARWEKKKRYDEDHRQ